ncbi:MAG: site-2 protease family protein [Planctomycetales bacterium]|nr:site-2 protease family protein [Planctomycetales bacterium]
MDGVARETRIVLRDELSAPTWGCATAFVVAGLGILALLVVSRGTPTWGEVGMVIWMTVAVGVAAGLLARAAAIRHGLVLDGEGLRWRDPVPRLLRWEDLARVELRRGIRVHSEADIRNVAVFHGPEGPAVAVAPDLPVVADAPRGPLPFGVHPGLGCPLRAVPRAAVVVVAAVHRARLAATGPREFVRAGAAGPAAGAAPFEGATEADLALESDPEIGPEPAPPPRPGAVRVPFTARVRFAALGGTIAILVLKLGKGFAALATALVKGGKAVKGGLALATVASLQLLFRWDMALGLFLLILVHELGHVAAMRRCGLALRGIYFIPFLGAVSVAKARGRSRGQQAAIALAGPAAGLLSALALYAAWVATGSDHLGALAIAAAVLNLFNLLPVSPLDGGRVTEALACSVSTGLGLVLGTLGLAVGLFAAAALDFWLVAALVPIGIVEFYAAWKSAQAGWIFRAIGAPPATLREDIPRLAGLLVQYPRGGEAMARAQARTAARRELQVGALDERPMGRGALLLATAATVALSVALAALALDVASHVGDSALFLLRS